MNYNKAIILGNVTRQPELRTTPSGAQVVNFGIATNRFYNDKNSGEKQQEVEFHNVVAWSRLAEIIGQYVNKGSLILVEGRIQTRSWDDKTTGQKRYATEIIAENIQLGPRRDNATQGNSNYDREEPSSPQRQTTPRNTTQDTEEEPIPTIDAGTPSEDDIDMKDIPF